ncbi:hypothetical protein WMF26_07560 [Sorangium sp. So ce185]|uniref:hypothetical protein n=1 Tax=Sorangium sp. So ce185 TaxID=3133287 RepID=UPI003F62E24E
MTDAPAPLPPQPPSPQDPAPEGPLPQAGALAPAPGAELAPPARVVPLASGRSIEIAEEGAGERIQIRAAAGQILVSIRMTDDGPVLSLAGASLEIAAAKTLSLSCDTLQIQAAQDAAIEVGGSLHERVRGSAVREAGRSARTTAREVKVEASPGGVEIRANDDVDIVGERVRLNSEDPPMPLSWEEFRARQALAGGPGQPAALAAGEAAPRAPDDRSRPGG